MKKLLAALGASLMLLGLVGVSQATADPGPNGSNDKGLCTAYFNGQKNGHDKGGAEDGSPDGRTDNARPFQELESEAGVTEETPADDVADMVYEWCLSTAGVEIGGNPNDNGRWTCTVDDKGNTDPADDEYNCDPNDAPNEGKGKPEA